MRKATQFPDFFVIGAQKCGTSSLCAMLEAHPQIVFSVPKEPLFLSRDEVPLHPHFFATDPSGWDRHDWQEKAEALLEEYRACFPEAKEGQQVGEGSTSYFPSRVAPMRIHHYRPDAKLILLLRHPVARAYSAYWHHVRHGTAIHSFAGHLRYENGMILEMGHYAEHLARWQHYFPKEQMYVASYERFVREPLVVFKDICDFLTIESTEPSHISHSNRGSVPRFLRLQLMINWLRRMEGNRMSAVRHNDDHHVSVILRLLNCLSRWNLCETPPPPMNTALEQRLNRYFCQANAGLDKLADKEMTKEWW